MQTQAPAVEQVVPAPQVPQEPVHPSLPQALPVQSGVQLVAGTHWPEASQFSVPLQAPHWPPQPSFPHTRPPQEGVQLELASAVRYPSRSVTSQEGRGAPMGIVLSTRVRVRMRSLQRRTSASVSKSTPTVAPPRAVGARLTEWQERQRVLSTPGPSERAQG